LAQEAREARQHVKIVGLVQALLAELQVLALL
jgi:hypothetical protein